MTQGDERSGEDNTSISCGFNGWPWAAHGSRFTLALEELGAFLARATDRTSASTMLGVTWVPMARLLDADAAGWAVDAPHVVGQPDQRAAEAQVPPATRLGW